MDFKKKKMTKQQVWDKLHAERKMWIQKCRDDARRAEATTAIRIRTITDLILSGVVRAYGTQEGDEWHLDIEKPVSRDGHIWSASIEEIDDHTIRIKVREDELEQKREEDE